MIRTDLDVVLGIEGFLSKVRGFPRYCSKQTAMCTVDLLLKERVPNVKGVLSHLICYI
jgi:hypothetical protein